MPRGASAGRDRLRLHREARSWSLNPTLLLPLRNTVRPRVCVVQRRGVGPTLGARPNVQVVQTSGVVVVQKELVGPGLLEIRKTTRPATSAKTKRTRSKYERLSRSTPSG